MYIHRVAIDANQANARGGLAAMTELERLHDACLIEIVCTSTIETDLRSEPQREKVSKYDRIHADGIYYLAGTPLADATPGPVLRKSRFLEIYKSVFGEFSQAAKLNSLRDALHLDQCWQNMVDYFVTDDKALYNCGDIDFTVCDAENCLERLREHFQKTEGTAQIGDLSRKLAESGPVILGSNSSGAFECCLGGDEDPLLRVEIGSGELSVYCTIRNDLGNTLIKILPGKEFEFSEGNANVHLLAGPSPLKLGTRQCKSFSITCDDRGDHRT
jgi:hypothetical protein